MSKNSAGKGRAVLEYVGLDTPAINMVYENNPRNEEAAVQAGLLQWVGSHCTIWEVIIEAMKHAGIAVQIIEKLMKELQKGTYALCVQACVS